MKIYADENMPFVRQFFADLGEIQLVDGRTLTPAQIADADVLLVRSVTKVNATLLAQNQQLKFVGTATIGVDHIDQPYLRERGICFSSAPGCNAQSVVEYILSSLFLLAEQQQKPLQQWTVAVIGVGQIGARLVSVLQALQVNVLQCDPIRAQQEPDFAHVSYGDLLQQASQGRVDALSFHVPLVTRGEHATVAMLDADRLRRLPETVAVLNACRGEVTCNKALLAEAQAGVRRPLVLDVWENEPNIATALMPFCRIATAHIAGHSVEGKARGTEMLYQALCKMLNISEKCSIADFCPVPAMEMLQISANFSLSDVQNLCRMLYDVRRDDTLFRFHLQDKRQTAPAPQGFDWLRKHYPPRREWSSLRLLPATPADAIPEYLIKLGFSSQH